MSATSPPLDIKYNNKNKLKICGLIIDSENQLHPCLAGGEIPIDDEEWETINV